MSDLQWLMFLVMIRNSLSDLKYKPSGAVRSEKHLSPRDSSAIKKSDFTGRTVARGNNRFSHACLRKSHSLSIACKAVDALAVIWWHRTGVARLYMGYIVHAAGTVAGKFCKDHLCPRANGVAGYGGMDRYCDCEHFGTYLAAPVGLPCGARDRGSRGIICLSVFSDGRALGAPCLGNMVGLGRTFNLDARAVFSIPRVYRAG